MAIAETKKGKNVALYTRLVEDFSSIAPNDSAALVDTTWAEKKTREVREEHDRLEHELKSYKNNLIKESIRVSSHRYHSIILALTNHRWAMRTSATSTMTLATSPMHRRHT